MSRSRSSRFVQNTCKRCGNLFRIHETAVHRGRGVFCSRKCQTGNPCSNREWLEKQFYAEPYLSIIDIAKLAGVNETTVTRWVKTFGLKRTKRHTPESRAKRRAYSTQPANLSRLTGQLNKGRTSSPFEVKTYNRYLYMAGRRGLEFSLTVEHFTHLQNEPCFYCGEVSAVLGFDRKDSSKGYTPENVVPCCKTCNFMKLDLSLERFMGQVEKIRLYAETQGRYLPFSYIDPTAQVGLNSKIWHFSTILANVRIGDNCSIGSGTEIGAGTEIGNESRISAHVFLPPNTKIGHRVFIGPGTVATDDKNPRAGNVDYHAEPPIFHDHCSVGANCTILPGVSIGVNAVIGAGSTVANSVPSGGKVYGEKAKLREVGFKHLTREYGWVGGT